MSTFRLEPEHFHLTTGTFNLIVKDRIASRLSGALSVRPDSPEGNPDVLETFQPYRVGSSAVNPLQSQDFHLFCTMGSCPPDRKTQAWGTLDDTQRNAASALKRHGLSARAEAEDGQISKDRFGGSAFRETLQGPCPRMRTPGSGVNLEAY